MPRDPEKQRAAKRRYYERNKDVYLAKNARKRLRLRQIMLEAKNVPCADCGRSYPPYVMDFDHKGDKRGLVSQMPYGLSLTRLIAEMAKCEVVCANCHRLRTHRRLLTLTGGVDAWVRSDRLGRRGSEWSALH